MAKVVRSKSGGFHDSSSSLTVWTTSPVSQGSFRCVSKLLQLNMGVCCTMGTFGHVRKEHHFLKVVPASARRWLGTQMYASLGWGFGSGNNLPNITWSFGILCIKTPISIQKKNIKQMFWVHLQNIKNLCQEKTQQQLGTLASLCGEKKECGPLGQPGFFIEKFSCSCIYSPKNSSFNQAIILTVDLVLKTLKEETQKEEEMGAD